MAHELSDRCISKQATASSDRGDDQVEYDLRSLTAPRLSGFLFKAFAKLLEAPVLGNAIRARLLLQNGFLAFREALPEASLKDAPRAVYPLHPVPQPDDIPRVTPAACTASVRERCISQLDAFFVASGSHLVRQNNRAAVLPERFDSIGVLHNGYFNNEFTPVQVVSALLERIERSNEGDRPLNAIIQVDADSLLDDAKASTARWRAGAPLSCLDGVPIALKSQLKVAGLSCTAGLGYHMKPLREKETEDGGIAHALRSVGALVGISASMDEMAVGVRGFNPHIGQILNPQNELINPGGSSSGCASAVAAGLVPCAVGTDGGGSCRIPAAACGIFGFKPTFARIGTHGRCQERKNEHPATIHIGPIASNALDLTYLYNIMALLCPHEKMPVTSPPDWDPDAVTLRVPEPMPVSLPQNISVGVYTPWMEDSDPVWVEATRDFLGSLQERGCISVKEVQVPNLENCRVAHGISILRDMLKGLNGDGVFEDGSDMKGRLGLDAQSKISIAREFTVEDAQRSEVVRAKAIADMNDVFAKVEFLVTPSLAEDPVVVPADKRTGILDVRADSAAMKYMFFANLTGIPACVVPVGRRSEGGIRRSVQIMGRPWAEKELLNFIQWIEHAS